MEDLQTKKNTINRTKKKKATVIESSKLKKIPIYQLSHKRSNSENIKKAPNKSLLESTSIINLITKGPSINKLFFKNDNISLKSESMPKTNKKQVKKFRSINICKGKNEIYTNLMLKKQNTNQVSKNSNNNLNYLNMDCYEKIHNLRGVAKDYIPNNNLKGEANVKKSRKPNFINKNSISNDKLMTFNNSLNKNPIYEFYQPIKEKEMQKKPLQKIQSVNQEKRKYKFSDFKVIKDIHEDDDDASLENINPDEYREGNIEFITGSSLSEENEVSSSLSSNDQDDNKRGNKEKKKEKKKKKTDKLSNLVNKSMKKKDHQNYLNSNNNSDTEDNFFKNDTKFFMSPKINSKHPSNKSLKSDARSDYFNNVMTYFNDSNNNDNKNSFLAGSVNKSKIKRIESLATNSNQDYEGDIDDEYDLIEMRNQESHYLDNNKFINNLTTNDSYIKSPDISQNHLNNTVNNDNITNIQTVKNINNMNDNYDTNNNNNNNNYYMNNNNDNNNNYFLNNNNENNNNINDNKKDNNNNIFMKNNIMNNINNKKMANINNSNYNDINKDIINQKNNTEFKSI